MTLYNSVREWIVNSEADINEMNLETVTMKYMPASFPLNPSYLGRQYASSAGMVDPTTDAENYYI